MLKGQEFPGYYTGDGEYRIRFMPKSLNEWTYAIESDIPEINEQTGQFVSLPESQVRRGRDPLRFPNWWSDMPEPGITRRNHLWLKNSKQMARRFLTRLPKIVWIVV